MGPGSCMTAYTLFVRNEGEAFPIETVRLANAQKVLDTISALLRKHPGCHRIHVHAGAARLFSVDCSGKNVPD